MHEHHAFAPASVRADPGATLPAADCLVGNRNRWSRAVLAFPGLAPGQWYEFSACMLCADAEVASAAKDFAAIGFAFLAQDRSEVDFAHVPGLGRTSMDAHGDWLAGPAAAGQGAVVGDTLGAGGRALPVRRRFYLPAPAAEVTVVIRSWRNAQPFRILDPEIRPAGPRAADPAGPSRLTRDGRIPLGPKPVWFRHGLVPGRPLVFKGQVIARGQTEGALARIAFRDARGSPIPPPYPDTLATLSIPAFLDIPVHRQAYRFTLKVTPPPSAATLEIGFAAWEAGADLALAGAPEVLLDDDLRLADLADGLAEDADPGAGAFLARLLGRLGGSPAGGNAPSIRPYLDPAALAERPSPLRGCARLRDGPDACRLAGGAVQIAPHPAWTLPDAPDWSADPFRSQAWRLAFQSLAWACAAAENPDRETRARAVAAALSWSRANPWGRPADGLSLHPACMALRLEALLGLLAAAAQDAADGAAVETLGGEVVRHAAALAEILAQHTVAGSPLEVQVGASLLAAGLALPAFPMARHWTGLATLALRRGFEALIDPEGGIAEPSYHRSLEILTLALVLKPVLDARPDLAALTGLLDERVPKAWVGLAALFEPDGALPPFDDAPDHPDRVGWLRRLAASQVRPAAAAPASPTASPSSPAGGAAPGPVRAARSGVLSRRRPDDGAGWSAFTADFSAQVHPQDHRDCTAFTFASGGLRWITEGEGRHLPAARAHNVAVPDGREPGAGAGFARAPVRLDDAVLHGIETSVHGPDYRHVRAFVLLEDLSGVAVLDGFATGDRPVSMEGFLHFDAAIMVALDASRRVFALHGERRLHIVPHVIAGRFGTVALGRARAGANLRYGLSGLRSVAGGLLIAASPESLARLAGAVEAEAVRHALAG